MRMCVCVYACVCIWVHVQPKHVYVSMRAHVRVLTHSGRTRYNTSLMSRSTSSSFLALFNTTCRSVYSSVGVS